jgi:glycosyltransferase involved in cell wall biosynthesis
VISENEKRDIQLAINLLEDENYPVSKSETEVLSENISPTYFNLLVIAYYYPPMGLSGVQRIAKFTKYLREFGWQTTVVTVGNVGYFAYDYSLLDEVLEAEVIIEQTDTIDPLKFFKRNKNKPVEMPPDRQRRFLSKLSQVFLQPDNKIGWKKFALKRVDELFAKQKFDAVLATAPPFTSLVIANEIQKKYGIPLGLDYRDPWLDNKNHFYATPFHFKHAFKLESEAVLNADAIVTVNRRIKESLMSRYSHLTHEKVHVLPSGFDPHSMKIGARFPADKPKEKFRITYSGIFDANRSPKFFFKAVMQMFQNHPETKNKVELCFIGLLSEKYMDSAKDAGVIGALNNTGYINHSEAVSYLFGSDALWLTIYDPIITPGKIYEYIGTRKPILVLTPTNGAMIQVLRNYDAAYFAQPEDINSISNAIYAMYKAWENNELPIGNEIVSKEFDQRKLAENLSRIISHTMNIE